jgi:glucan biosynthesis protein C
VFFLAGWLVNINSASFFSQMAKYALGLVATGIAISVFVFYMDFRFPDHKNNLWMHLALKVLAAGQILLLVYGSTGFFLRFFKSESKLWKYISDASYWMYLIHLMIVAALQVLFLQFEWPGLVKFALILVITLTITLVTYQFWIRYHYIGTLLHGKRQKSPRQ